MKTVFELLLWLTALPGRSPKPTGYKMSTATRDALARSAKALGIRMDDRIGGVPIELDEAKPMQTVEILYAKAVAHG